MYLYEDETGKYIVGADSVPKKLGEPQFITSNIKNTRNDNNVISIDCSAYSGNVLFVIVGTWAYGVSGQSLRAPESAEIITHVNASGVGTTFAYMENLIFKMDVTNLDSITITATGNRNVMGISCSMFEL